LPGTNAAQSFTGLGFKPDFVWIKDRDTNFSHALNNSLQGATKYLKSNSTDALTTDSTTLTSFDSDGFSIGSAGGSFGNSSDRYVAWNWKATPTPSINTDGTIQSLVSANQAAGFSIVAWTGDGNASSTVGHGLSGTPDFLMLKDLTDAGGWNGAQVGLASNEGIGLQSSAAAFTGMGGNGGITYANFSATNFGFATGSSGVDSVNKNGNQYVAYCWKSVAGFSSIGSYTGVSSGVTITTGFRPSFIMVKSSSNVENWAILDTTRGTGKVLNPNLDAVEGDSALNTFTVSDTGFSFPDQSIADAMLNENGYEYIYMAFKENPSTTVVPAGEMAFLLVAGGGGGGIAYGGGGGAGGLRTSFGSTSGGGASAETNITLANGIYNVTIGAGGAGISAAATGNSGSNSSISGNASFSTTGGGGGGSSITNTSAHPAGSGGSGGGGSVLGQQSPYTQAGAAGTANEGFGGGQGGFGSFNGTTGAGGGGGAGAAGDNGKTSGYRLGGNGGDGLAVNIIPGGVFAGGGGAGGEGSTDSTPGIGGGGKGGYTSASSPKSGVVNTGGGGGGSGNTTSVTSGAGGSGVGILRMRTADYSGTTSGSPIVRVYGEETILVFTGSGSYTHS